RGKAATLHALAGLEAQSGNVAKARELYQESLTIKEQIGNARGKAATLHQLAGLEEQSGNVAKARELYQESLTIKEQIGDARGKAATLHALAGLEAQSGNVAKARELYQESLTIKEQIGDARGKAATLASLAVLEYDDDQAQARARLWSAAAILGGIGASPDLAAVLQLLVQTEGDDYNRTIAAAQSLLVSLSGLATAERLSSAVSVLLSSGVLDEGTQCAGIYLAAALLEDDVTAGLIAEARADLGVRRTNEEWLAHHGINTQEAATARFTTGLTPFMDNETWVLPRVDGA
ncbi:MAG: tetratricopeptide repeat protein, partial [Sulfitobacter sp.]|nr:tetratricopeptide repeat protein [Sulfitobacter sp.]